MVQKSLIFTLLLASFSFAQEVSSVRVSWDANSEADLKGYKCYMGKAQRNYTQSEDVGNNLEYVWRNLDGNTLYYFAVTAYDTAGNESQFSAEVSIKTRIIDKTPPSPPGGIKVGLIGILLGAIGVLAIIAIWVYLSSLADKNRND